MNENIANKIPFFRENLIINNMKNLILISCICMFFIGCSENKTAHEFTINGGMITLDTKKNNENILNIEFGDDIVLSWDSLEDNFIIDQYYMDLKKDKKKIKVLLDNITNNQLVNVETKLKSTKLKKGDLAFLYLIKLDKIYYFECLQIQFDVFSKNSSYPDSLVDYLENNRKEAQKKMSICLHKKGYI